MEEFRKHPTHDCLVGNLGTIRSTAKVLRRKSRWGGYDFREMPSRDLKPYRCGGYLGLRLKQGAMNLYVHRLVAETWLPADETRKEVNHHDGNKKNNAASNLEWASHSENQRHSTHVLGNKGGQFRPKLSQDARASIRMLRATDGLELKELASMFGVSATTICRICA